MADTALTLPSLRQDSLVLQVLGLTKSYLLGGKRLVHAVSDVSFEIAKGEILALVGDSGCGKTTISRSLLLLPRPDTGRIYVDGIDYMALPARELRRQRVRIQMVFQDAIGSLNPTKRVCDIVSAPLRILGAKSRPNLIEDVREILEAVGLDSRAMWDRRPHEISGGQCQRVSLARAMISRPSVLICDEPVSSLDVSVQAQILNQIDELRTTFGVGVLFVSHDLAVVRHISDRVAVMYLGRLCEMGTSAEIYARPAHPYTATLLSAVLEPVPQPKRVARSSLRDDLPSALNPPTGCRFHPRCSRASERCAVEVPMMRTLGGDRQVACHHPLR